MKSKRKAPKTNSRDKKDIGGSSGTKDAADLTEAEKLVGVHILGKEDTVRHFPSSGDAEQEDSEHDSIEKKNEKI